MYDARISLAILRLGLVRVSYKCLFIERSSDYVQIADMESYCNIGESHYHKENKTNGGKQIEFSAESNQFEQKSKVGINEMFSNC